VLKAAKRWLHRDADKVPAAAAPQLAQARAAHPVLDKMVTMREELRQLWLNTSHRASNWPGSAGLVPPCRSSGIAATARVLVQAARVQGLIVRLGLGGPAPSKRPGSMRAFF
jgi:stearoyl-CoA desaturase (delta-9 desaturase)